jgi:3-isopropylmalate/(R)-2-methylmalate dehydratase small subunit
MAKFTTLASRLVPLPVNNIDTDQIIPARYLKATDKDSLAGHLFADWRYKPTGDPKPEFVLNQPQYQDAQVLLAGENFGCGSSREHAPWALTGYGFRAVISTCFADIFRNNALKNGLLPVVVDSATHQALLDMAAESPQLVITIDLESQTLHLPDGTGISFPIDSFARTCLLNDIDELGYLLKFEPMIAAYEETHR